VSDARWFKGWVPWTELAALAAAGRALIPAVPATPAAVLRSASEQLVGRRLTMTTGGTDVELTLAELDYRADSLQLAIGKLGDVRVVAEDITWPETHLKRVTVVAREVRVRSFPAPSVLPASVAVEIVVTGEVMRSLSTKLRPEISAEPAESGLVAIRWARHPRWGHAEFEPGVAGSDVLLRPRALRVAGLRIPLPARLKPVLLPPLDLPQGLRLTGIGVHGDELVLHAVAEEWPERLSRIPLPDLLAWLTTAALTRTIPRFGRRS
jgi:hypothetical protein